METAPEYRVQRCFMPFGKPTMLFVDDRTKRLEYALSVLSEEYAVRIAVCVPEALRSLSSEDFDFVSLDHDLNGYDFQDPDTPTCGMEIVRYIEKTGWPQQRRHPVFYCHSSNLFASHLIETRLQAMGFRAYHQVIDYKTQYLRYDEKGNPIS